MEIPLVAHQFLTQEHDCSTANVTKQATLLKNERPFFHWELSQYENNMWPLGRFATKMAFACTSKSQMVSLPHTTLISADDKAMRLNTSTAEDPISVRIIAL